MFFLANGKYFLTRKSIFFGGGGGGGNLALLILSVLKTAETKYFIFSNILFPS